MPVSVKIGIAQSPDQMGFSVADTKDAISSRVDEAMTKENSILWFTDTKGTQYGVPTARIAFLELTEEADGKKVGFGA